MFDPELWAFAKKSFGILARAVIVALTIIGLIFVGIAVNWTFRFAAKSYSLGAQTEQLLFIVNLLYIIVLALAIMILSILDVLRVVRTSIESSGDVEDGDERRDK